MGSGKGKQFNALQIQQPKSSFEAPYLTYIFHMFISSDFDLIKWLFLHRYFSCLLLVLSELDAKDDDTDGEDDDDFVCGACDIACDAAESVETCDDFRDDDTDEDDDDRALAAPSGVRMSRIFHGETEGILGSFFLHFEPSRDCK